jgi:hypothetical protein
MFEIHGTFDLNDLIRFQYFHTLRRTWPVAVFVALILILIAPLGALAIIDFESWGQAFTNALPFVLLLAFWLFLLGVMPYRNAKKALIAHSYVRVPITYTFTDEVISAAGPSVCWSLAWNVMKQMRETRSLFLLYHAPNLAVIVPKRFFQRASEMQEWRQFVSTHLGSKRIDTVGLVARWC